MRKGRLRNRLSGEVIDVTATTNHTMSSYNLPVWVDKDNVAYLQCDTPVENPIYEVVYDSNWGRAKVGNMIAELRQKRGLSQRQLAKETGLSYANIAKLETGRYNVSVDILYKLLEALDGQLIIIDKAAR